MAAASPAERLILAARALLPRAVAPYSGFPVAAVLEDAEGGVHPGVNVESASYGLTLCAERNALFGALSRGVRSFRRIAVVGGRVRPILPCGACRQVLYEHAPDLIVVTEDARGAAEELALRDLLPRPFTLPSDPNSR